MAAKKKTTGNTKTRTKTSIVNSPTRKVAAKKSTSKKSSTAKKSAPAKKASAKKSSARKTAVKKTVRTKISTAKKSAPANKKTSKKTVAKKSAPKKTTNRKKAGNKKKGKSTSELLKAIKARDIEIHKQEVKSGKKTAKTKAPTGKAASKKASAKRQLLTIVAPMQKPVEVVASAPKKKSRKRRIKFSQSALDKFKKELLFIREHFTGQTDAMKHDALQRDDEVNPEEDGTDAFMRLQALNQMNDQQHIVIDIDKALAAIEDGSYGVCEICKSLISRARLKALPFAKFCVNCKSEMENGLHHRKKH